MEIHDPNLHLKLIEMCDCYLETDYQVQLQRLATTPSEDLDEDSMKYLALAIMYAVTEKAQKLTFKRKKENLTVTIKSSGEKNSIKAPSREIFDKIISMVRSILHIEEDKAAIPLALGLRSGDMELQVKVERNGDKESLKFKFPNMNV